MITLDIAHKINSILGAADTISYGKFYLSNISYDTENMRINGQIKIKSAVAPDMQAINGTLKIDCATAKLTIEIGQIGFFRRKVLTGPVNAAAQALITDAQNALEGGLCGVVKVVAGTQTPGT